MADVFISYARQDEPVARQFAEGFIAAGMDVWWDNHLRSGDDWDTAIEQALREASVVVVLWSPHSVRSRWVRAEATVAQRAQTLVPTIIQGCDLPIVFEMIQTADLTGWDGSLEDTNWQGFVSDVAAKAGHSNRASPQASEPALPDPLPPAGERRRITVLAFSLDLARAGLDDPEDRIEIVGEAIQLLRQTMAPFAGECLDGHGDRLTVLFGLARAREDDAMQAVEAALAAREAVAGLCREQSVEIGLECGLRTGTIVVEGESGKPMGGALEEAHRMLASAKPGDILLCQTTNNLIAGYFPTSRGEDGLARVEGPQSAETRFELARKRGLVGFVGREQELDILRKARDKAASGEGQLVELAAEAGSGKSRLCHEFKSECLAMGMPVIEGAAHANSRAIPLFVVQQMFRSFFAIASGETRADARGKIESWIDKNEPKLKSALALLFEFLSLAGQDAQPTGLEPAVRQRQLVALMRHLVSIAGAQEPVLMLIEDLHWLDDASANFLEQLIAGQPRSPSLLVLNYRPEFRPRWVQGEFSRHISLKPLGSDSIDRLLEELVGSDRSTLALREPIRARAKGNPFFVEEIVRNLAETGALTGEKSDYRFVGDAQELSVPDTIKSLLSARIDRLDQADKSVLQAASVIGRDFDEPLLEQICDIDSSALADALANLQRNEFIEETEIFPVSRFSFRHPLTQETAMAGLLRKHRKTLHRRIATALEERKESEAASDEIAPLIARHWQESGEAAKAVPWYARAARWLMAADYPAAITNWQKTREIIGPEPKDEQAIGLAVEANLQLLNLNFRVKVDLDLGHKLLEEGDAFAQMIGDPSLKLQQSMLFSRIQCGAGDLPGYLDNARANLARAREIGDDGLVLVGTIMLVDACNYSNLYDEVIELCDLGCRTYPRDLPRESWPTSFNPYSFFVFTKGATLGWMGQYSEMLDQFSLGYRLASEDGTPEVICWILFLRTIFATAANDRDIASRSVRELREVSETAGVPLNFAHLHLAEADWAIFEGRFDDAITSAQKAREFFALLERQWEAFALMLYARALLGKKDFDEAEEMGRKTFETGQKAGVVQMAAAGLIVACEAAMQKGDKPAEPIAMDLGLARDLIDERGVGVLVPALERAERHLEEFSANHGLRA